MFECGHKYKHVAMRDVAMQVLEAIPLEFEWGITAIFYIENGQHVIAIEDIKIKNEDVAKWKEIDGSKTVSKDRH